ncbi:DsbA family protein [Robiginitomaculum antarcticum]|uniref:DsbA family protein n=1 Tax=Robiginitomaculum antarcticum TaxID=437507 RepID=UPI0003637190|nr:DsbA family protein [Robiginitomaculum antarcticum]
MTDSFKTFLIAALMGSALSLAACGGDKTASAGNGNGERSQYELAGDHAIGNPDAKVTVVEYASVTCSHCATWHKTVWPQFRKDYVDTGKVRFIYREFPTSPVKLAETGFMIARCADEDKYFANIGLQYERQAALFEAAGNGEAKKAYTELARAAGLSEDEFEQCLANEDEYEAMQTVIKGGFERGVSATPTFIINGDIAKVYMLEDFDEAFKPFIDVPQRDAAEDTSASDGDR